MNLGGRKPNRKMAFSYGWPVFQIEDWVPVSSHFQGYVKCLM